MKRQSLLSFFKSKKGVFILFLLIGFIFSREIILTPGLIGLRDDWLMVPFASQHQFSTTRFLYSWFGGNAFYRNLGEIPGIILGSLSFLFKFNGEFYSKFFVLFFPALAGFNFYKLSTKLKISHWPAILSGFVYISSPFFYNSIISGYILFLIVFALLPLMLRLYIELLEEKKLDVKKAIYLAIIIRLAITQDNAVYIAGILIFSYFIFHNLIEKNLDILKKTTLKSLSVALFVVILTAQFLILIPLDLQGSLSFVSSGLDTWITDLSPKIIPALFQDGGGYHYFLTSISKDAQPVWFVALSLFTAALAASVFFAKKNKYILYFCLLFILGTLGFKGTNPPLGAVNKFFYQYLPVLMGGFRNSQYFTVISALGQAFCFAALLHYFNQYFFKNKKALTYIIFILLVVVRALPFFSGNYQNQVQNVVLGKDLLKLDQTLRQEKDNNTVLFLPPIVPVTYKDSKFAGLDIMTYGQPHNFIGIAGDSPFQRQLIEHLYISDNQDLFRWFMSIYNVQHVAWRDDFKSITVAFMSLDYIKHWPVWTNERLFENVINMPQVSLNQEISPHTALYQYSRPFPLIYSPQTITFIDEDPLKPLTYADILPQEDLSAVVFSKQQNSQLLDLPSSTSLNKSPVIDYTYVNPTKYKLEVKNATEPFVLILSQNYHSLWEILGPNGQVIDQPTHFRINGYANAWIINPQLICQKISCQMDNQTYTFNLATSFSAQKYYLPAALLSYGSLLLSVLLLLLHKEKDTK
jgi:hypothetical protein